jgi:hypothetical protein
MRWAAGAHICAADAGWDAIGHTGASPPPETLRDAIIEGGKFYEQNVIAQFNKRRASWYTDGTTVGPKATYTVLSPCIEISDRCRCDFVCVFEYDIASAGNIGADLVQILVERVDAGIVPIAVLTDGWRENKKSSARGGASLDKGQGC